MNATDKTWIVGGLVLVLAGLLFGLWYAIFDEHQTLEAMGGAFAGAFVAAAERDAARVDENLARLGEHSYAYLREVSVHAHIIELGTLALLVPLFGYRIRLGDRTKMLIAWAFLAGSAVFCVGVYLQIPVPGLATQVLSAVGAGVAIAAVGALAAGLVRSDSGH